MLEERLAVEPLSEWEWDVYRKIRDWTAHGVPDDGKPVPPADSHHRLNPEELRLSIDKLARFIQNGFV